MGLACPRVCKILQACQLTSPSELCSLLALPISVCVVRNSLLLSRCEQGSDLLHRPMHILNAKSGFVRSCP